MDGIGHWFKVAAVVFLVVAVVNRIPTLSGIMNNTPSSSA
jgi:hypothetical protein